MIVSNIWGPAARHRGQKRPIFGLEWRKQPSFRLLRLGASWRVQGEVQLVGSRFAILSLIIVLAHALCGRLKPHGRRQTLASAVAIYLLQLQPYCHGPQPLVLTNKDLTTCVENPSLAAR